jgi:hypothetical protein
MLARMLWFLVFLGVALVWVVVLALLGLRLWRKGKALASEVAAAERKIADAQRSGLDRPA